MASAILAKSCGYSRRRNSRTARETSCHSFTVSAPCPASCPHPARPGSDRHFTHLLRLRQRPLQSLAAVLLRPYFLRSFERSPTRAATFFSESSATVATATASPISLTNERRSAASVSNPMPMDCFRATYSRVASLRFIAGLPNQVLLLPATAACLPSRTHA